MQNDDMACLAEHWRSFSQKRRDGPQSALFWDKRAEGFSRNIKSDRREKKRTEVFELIKKTGLELNGAEVLDIGCGPGTLAVPLAEMGARVTALDISVEMLKKLENRVREEGLTSIKTIQSSWSDIDIDALGFQSRFDLVIASMTPGINGPETFEKMIQASRNVCYYSNFVSRKWDVSYYELYQVLFGEKYGDGGYGFHLPFMYLYSMGSRPFIKISKNNWKSDETVDSMVETVSGFFGGRKDIDDEMRLRMRRYFEERAEGGRYHSETESITGMMVWEKNGR
ncbi:MAG: class I SAM-dependent methyltransferase [Methanothrix sp.]|nr:class I SAM-dependent methyltransferase [Methanothrix sp.]